MRWSRLSKNRDLDEEIEAHLALEIQQRMERGETREQAERAARRVFGNTALVKEVTRQMWGFAWLEAFAQDVRYALRMMRKAPGFTAVAVLTLVLGIGANTAIFGIVNAAMFQPLPFPESGRLVRIQAVKNGVPVGTPSPLDMRDLAAAAQSFEGIAAYDRWRKNVSGIHGSNDAEEMIVGLVPANFFSVLGLRPLMGRAFSEQEMQAGKNFVAAVSERFWRDRLAADPHVLGDTLRINSETYTIVAVMPDAIPVWLDQTSVPTQIWTPFAFSDIWTEASRGPQGYFAIGRLKRGVSYQQAAAEMSALGARLSMEHPLDQGIGVALEPLADMRAGPVRPIVVLLAGAVGLVLLIACSNLAGLLLARNSVRQREMALRSALGAGRGRLMRQLLCESLVLAAMGGAGGLVLSWLAPAAFARMSATSVTPYTTASQLRQFWPSGIDPRVFVFALAISILTALLCGLAPALAAARTSVADTLKDGARGSTAGGKQRFRRALVIGEIALSLILVIAAGLLEQTILRLQAHNPGFRADHLLKAHLFLPPVRYPDPGSITRFCDQLSERIRALPGVVDATATEVYPPNIIWREMFTIEGRPIPRIADAPRARGGVTDERFLSTLGVPLISGRDFAASDTPTSVPVALINQQFARRYFANENPLGRRIRLGPPPGVIEVPRAQAASGTLTVIGVFENFANDGIALPPQPQILSLFRQQPPVNVGFKDIVVRTAMDPESIAPAVARILKSLDADLPLGEVQSISQHLSEQISQTRLTTGLLSLFAALGTLLAAIGAYSVISYLVTQRTQEMGVRVALGASSRDILWLILRQGLSMGFSGLALGIAGAIAAQRFLASSLYQVSGTDPATIAGCSAVLLVIVASASILPAIRASRIDPIEALRGG